MPPNNLRDGADSSGGDRLWGSSLSAAAEAGATHSFPQRRQTTGLPAFSSGISNALPHCGQEKRITTSLLSDL
jgi:hypothetical protein